LFEIEANGVSPNKLIVGKPGNTGDATNGYMTPAALETCITEAKDRGWKGGLMVWEYPDQAAGYIETVWGS